MVGSLMANPCALIWQLQIPSIHQARQVSAHSHLLVSWSSLLQREGDLVCHSFLRARLAGRSTPLICCLPWASSKIHPSHPSCSGVLSPLHTMGGCVLQAFFHNTGTRHSGELAIHSDKHALKRWSRSQQRKRLSRCVLLSRSPKREGRQRKAL